MKKIAIVTGGNRGIGLAISRSLKEVGYSIATIHKSDGMLIENMLFDLEFIGDVYLDEDVEKFYNMVKTHAKMSGATVNVLVNNAGVASAKKFMDLTEHDFSEVFTTNLMGAFKMSQAFAKACETGSNKEIKSHIINISSVSGLTGFSGHAHYCASKFALDGMSKVMAKELSKLGIAVNNVCPGPTKTDMWDKLDREYKEQGFMPEEANEDDYSQKLLIKRMGTPEDVGNAVSWIVSQDYITGINLPVCGGNIIR